MVLLVPEGTLAAPPDNQCGRVPVQLGETEDRRSETIQEGPECHGNDLEAP